MRVLVNGLGNIGSSILNLLLDFQAELGIGELHALKNTSLNAWNYPELQAWQQRGVHLHHAADNPYLNVLSPGILPEYVNYVFDCTANGFGLRNKEWYKYFTQLRGGCAQGSEYGFGQPYMAGINDAVITGQPWAQIVSCNTHGSASILRYFADQAMNGISDADFVVVRRSEDLGGHQRLVSANVVSRHRDAQHGTHHAADLGVLLASLGIDLAVQSSDVTTPSQLLHAIRFNIGLQPAAWPPRIKDSQAGDWVAQTAKFDSNVVFEAGRRYGRYGRIYAHAIIVSNNLLFDHAQRRVKGWAFVPQEGNTILSSLQAFLLQTANPSALDIMQKLRLGLLPPLW